MISTGNTQQYEPLVPSSFHLGVQCAATKHSRSEELHLKLCCCWRLVGVWRAICGQGACKAACKGSHNGPALLFAKRQDGRLEDLRGTGQDFPEKVGTSFEMRLFCICQTQSNPMQSQRFLLHALLFCFIDLKEPALKMNVCHARGPEI